MTRSAEFCYIAEREDGAFLSGLSVTGAYWDKRPELAVRITEYGRPSLQQLASEMKPPVHLGFRKVLAS